MRGASGRLSLPLSQTTWTGKHTGIFTYILGSETNLWSVDLVVYNTVIYIKRLLTEAIISDYYNFIYYKLYNKWIWCVFFVFSALLMWPQSAFCPLTLSSFSPEDMNRWLLLMQNPSIIDRKKCCLKPLFPLKLFISGFDMDPLGSQVVEVSE